MGKSKACYSQLYRTGSATIFFGTIVVVVGALIPLLFGRETVGQLETVTEAAAPVLA